MVERRAYVVGTFDTKGDEHHYVAGLIRAAGVPTTTVDVGTKSDAREVDVTAAEVAASHPDGAAAVLGAADRGVAVTAMTEALRRWIGGREDVGGMIGLAGSGGTAIIAPTMRALPIGTPRMLVSTLAAGDMSAYLGIHDITSMFPVTDVAGLNRISRVVLGNAAHALAGMMLWRPPASPDEKPALGLSMFGVTTPCVMAIQALVAAEFDAQVFHANGHGGRALEALVDAGLLRAVLDISTTEAMDHLFGGVCTAGPERFDAISRTGTPWIGSVGAFDMINFWARETVPEHHRDRLFHVHNANVTLMRTTPAENREAGAWLAEKLNRSPGPVRLLLPEGGVSMLDAPGQPFHAPEASAALFEAIEGTFVVSDAHRIRRVPHHINDPAFAAVIVRELRDVLAAEP
ncbi:Tm-1-like ATP-binding domain-containing protein [uncultured Enterovirga sp.]|uniref:Tm-1-like ATP-binding domain-containing protein n=1 Tax=uncultured Enterovirga sp. TaxID=2026352 RepID=UPI0035CA7685